MATQVTLIGIEGIPPVVPGDDVGALLVAAMRGSGLTPVAGDAVVVTSKIISKAEGCVVDLRSVTPSAEARDLAARTDKEPELVELVLGESTGIVRAVPGVLIVRHRLGFTSANAAIDRSNADGGEHTALLMPRDPDASARAVRDTLADAFGVDVAVVVSDTHGRPWRRGNVGVAVGVAGLEPVVDMAGAVDLFGRELKATMIPIADQLAGAAALVSGEADEGLPVVLVRGLDLAPGGGSSSDLTYPGESDLFR
ncbi:MAG TPA: coenzyme F420-0:L-glutamate ligase [Acidimicrobiia bacterium]|nr:coenzyme F420-0:L-glutamate ligase [Acidimicrobiia bacterium]